MTRLRPVLWVVVVLGAIAALLALTIVVDDPGDPAGWVATGIGLVLAAAGTVALRLLRAGSPRTRSACVTTGVLCVLCGIGLAGSWLALLLPLTGLGLLFLALIPDEEAPR